MRYIRDERLEAIVQENSSIIFCQGFLLIKLGFFWVFLFKRFGKNPDVWRHMVSSNVHLPNAGYAKAKRG